MKNKKFSFSSFVSVIILFVVLGLVILASSIPDSALITEKSMAKEILPIGSKWLCSIKEQKADTVWQNTSTPTPSATGAYSATVYFCGLVPIKTVDLSISDNRRVYLGGDAVGISLWTDGVLVVGLGEVETPNGKTSPAKDGGIKEGDIIKKVDGHTVKTTNDIKNVIKKSKDKIIIEGERDGKKTEWEIKPVSDKNENKKIGIWVRDTVSGIGTLTYYTDTQLGLLGHPISDVDTGSFVKALGGSIYEAKIISTDKGTKGKTGSLCGIFTGEKLGTIEKNTPCGVFGKSEIASVGQSIAIGKKGEIECDKALMFCDTGDGVQSYDIEITGIYSTTDESKSMVIHITDEDLIQKTGGIVQGMSGSPIVQNGKLVGAVTHVFVNDPTRGYGIFIENMLAEAEKFE